MTTIYTYNGQVLKEVSTGKWLAEKDQYNPLGLPPNTIRVRTSDGNEPIKAPGYQPTSYETATKVAGTSDVYDVYKSGTDFSNFLMGSTNVIEVLGANTTGITQMNSMFYACSSLTTVPLFDTTSVTRAGSMFNGCSSLTSVPLFDTSNNTNMGQMFKNCNALTSIPLFNTSNVTTMQDAFKGCANVESGALALYQQASSQTTPPYYHDACFRDCGANTVTGAAELAQIPSDWK